MQNLTTSIQNVMNQRSASPCLATLSSRDLRTHPRPPPPPHAQAAPLMEKRVEIHGTKRADMNGKRGVATDVHYSEGEAKWRYTVKLDGGEAFKLKRANVRAEGAGGAGKGKGKAKGKKGRAARK